MPTTVANPPTLFIECPGGSRGSWVLNSTSDQITGGTKVPADFGVGVSLGQAWKT